MDIRKEIKSLIALRGSTLTKVCQNIHKNTNKKFAPNSITNKFARKTIKFDEVLLILDELGYDIQFIERK